MASQRVPASYLAAERTRRRRYQEALRAITELSAHDDPEGWNEWGEASCFNKAQELARKALGVTTEEIDALELAAIERNRLGVRRG